MSAGYRLPVAGVRAMGAVGAWMMPKLWPPGAPMKSGGAVRGASA